MGDSNISKLSSLQARYDDLREMVRSLDKVAIAFSGGVDSTLLLKIAHGELGTDVLAVTAKSPLVPVREIFEAIEFCESEGIEHVLMDFDPFAIDGFDANGQDRCYLCKDAMLRQMEQVASEHGISKILDGSNADDANDFRPGSRAVAEHGVISPLKDMGMTKDDIRLLSMSVGLESWDKPSFACLASRIPCGDRITTELLSKIERSEEVLFEEGFEQFRVRAHGNVARIEVDADEIDDFLDQSKRERISAQLHELGFSYVSLDLDGYRTGSLNS